MEATSNRRVYRRDMPRRSAGRRRKRRRSRLPLLLLLLILLGVILLFLIRGMLPGSHSTGTRLVILDEAWTAGFVQLSGDEDRTRCIETALNDAKSVGADGVLWTARAADGSALFRPSKDSELTANSAMTGEDSLFHKYDALTELVEQADDRSMAVLLLPTNTAGEILDAENAEQCDAAVLAAAKKHGLKLCAAGQSDSESVEKYEVLSYTLENDAMPYLRCDQSAPALAALMEQDGVGSAILGELTSLRQDSTNAQMLSLLLNDSTELPDLEAAMRGLSISQELAVSYPTAKIYTDTCFLMGTSSPELPLTISGGTVGDIPVAVNRYGSKGVWGFLVSLSAGENTFTLSQEGGASLEYTVERPTSSGGTAGGTGISSDGSAPAVWGQRLRVTSGAASLLTAYDNADSIAGTLYQNATLAVYNSERFVRSGKYTYAYQLSDGSYILAKDVELLDADTPTPVLTAGESSYDSLTRCTVLTYQGGTPAVTHDWQDNAITLTFLNCRYDGEAPAADGFITESSVENLADEAGFVLRLRFADSDPLYGWTVQYDTENNTTTLYLKHQPALSGDENKPLTGIRVLLDAGHGQDDGGSMGSAGYDAPIEKDANLAETLAAKHRLEQLGATVLLTREDDTFYTLDERLAMLNEQKPDFFIAVHHNSAALTTDLNQAGGTECYWFYTEGKTLAENLAASVSAAAGRTNRGSLYNYYYVTRSNICPAVLLESGFMTAPAEYESCVDTDVLWSEGGAIAQSVLACVKSYG